MELLLYIANCVGNQTNCIYPNRVVVASAEELREAVKKDHVCAEYRNDRRKKGNGFAISEGRRNSTLSRFVYRILKCYGMNERAYQLFLEEAEKCDPPMDEEELRTIWGSATKFFKNKVVKQEGYADPEKYNVDFVRESLQPSDYSDIGQAKILAKEYGDEFCYTSATDYLRFNSEYWVESKQQAVGAMEEFLDLQLADAQKRLMRAAEKVMSLGMTEGMLSSKSKKLQESFMDEQLTAIKEYNNASGYLIFVFKRRDMKYVTSALLLAKPMLGVQPSEMDTNAFLLNAPAATYYLLEGVDGTRGKDVVDLITKQTSVSPGMEGKEIWEDALNTFFCNDQALIDYVQMVVGMASIGMVCIEALIIAYGGGRNGKSRFWNAVFRVLGTYSGGISSDELTVGCRRNVKPEMAELKGKQLVIAAELEEGMRLNTYVINNLFN